MLKKYELKERVLIVGAILCSLALIYLLHDDSIFDQWSVGDNQRIGEITSLENDVRHKANKGFQWRVLRHPRSLNWGDGIFTGKGSEADVTLDTGAKIHLQENSLVIFTPSQKDLLLDLRFGNFKGSIAADSHIKVNDGNDILDLTGKDAQIEIGRNGKGELAIAVVNGELTANKNGVDKSLTAGSIARLDKKGELVAEMAKKVDREPAQTKPTWRSQENTHEAVIPVDENAKPTGAAPLKLKWDTPRKNQKYQLQIASDSDFKSIVSDSEIAGGGYDGTLDKEGSYFARIRPVAGDDQTWSNSEVVNVKLGTPQALQSPELKKKSFMIDGVQNSEAKLEWKKVDKAEEYVVELARNESFDNVVKTIKTKDTAAAITEFSDGKTFARVRAVTASGRLGDNSETARIQVNTGALAIEPIPEIRVLGKSPLAPPEPVDLKIKWNPLAIAKAYELQISKEEDFSSPLKFKTASPSGSLKVKDPGSYHMRVRPLDHDGKPLGNFSSPQKVDYVYRIPLAAPTLLEPSNNITMFFQQSDAPFYFVWKKVQQADWYIFEVAIDTDFNKKLVSQRVEDMRFLFKPNVNQGQLYWRVKAWNAERESNWSQTRTIKLFSGRRATE